MPAYRACLLLAILSCGLPTLSAASDDLRYPPGVTTDEQKEAWRIGWPALHGPFSNGSAIDCGYELVDRFSEARKVWTSEAHTVPSSKHAFHGIRGGYASPVLAAASSSRSAKSTSTTTTRPVALATGLFY